jgi:4-amino-4-deoxy-L-arabinose transferase-like glycosyltransferase
MPAEPSSRAGSTILAGVILLYLVLAIASARSLMPWCDEAWFSGPAQNLVYKGYMGTPVLDATAAWHVRDLTRIDRYTYWIMPLYPYTQSGWLRLAGSGLFSVRLYSVFWGLVALFGWMLVVWKLTGDQRMALLTAALIAIDAQFVWSSAVGRMDMMCAALGVAGVAAFLYLRERHLSLAIVTGHACMVAAGLAHPTAIGAAAGLVFLTFYFDRGRLRFYHLPLAMLPYMVGAGCWGLYIAQDPALFWSQFKGDASNRVLSGPFLEWLRLQTEERYLYMFGLAPETRGFSHAKILILIVYAIGVVGALASPRIRREKGSRAILLLWIVWTSTVAFVDKEIHPFYLIHFLLPLTAILAVWLCSSWDARSLPRWALAGLLAVIAGMQLVTAASRIRQDDYHKNYLAATSFLQKHAARSDRIFGSAELAFEVGWYGPLIDDYRLGCRTGKKAAYVVLDQNRYVEWIGNLQKQEPETYRFIHNMLDSEFKLVHRDGAYQIYARKG